MDYTTIMFATFHLSPWTCAVMYLWMWGRLLGLVILQPRASDFSKKALSFTSAQSIEPTQSRFSSSGYITEPCCSISLSQPCIYSFIRSLRWRFRIPTWRSSSYPTCLFEHPHRLDREHRISIEANRISWSEPENHQVALLGRYDHLPWKVTLTNGLSDPQSSFGSSLPGTIDIGILPSLRKLSFRLSFGDIGRDLVGLCDLLDSTSQPLDELRILEISIVFPNQSAPHRILEIRRHIFWSQLATVLEKPEYSGLRHLSVHLTIRRKARTERHAEDSVTEFRKQIKHALRHVSSMSTFQFRFKVHTFNNFNQNQQA